MSAVDCTVEIWKPVVNFEGFYEMSNWGNVRSLQRTVPMSDGRTYRVSGKMLKQSVWVYSQACLSKGGLEVCMLTHLLVLRAFVGPCPDGLECRHLDGNPINNRLDNLCWGTPKENQGDRIRHNTSVSGRLGNSHKLSKCQVEQIKNLRETGHTVDKIASTLGVTAAAIFYHLRKRDGQTKRGTCHGA